MILNNIILLSNLAKEQVKYVAFKRHLLSDLIGHSDKTFLGILGPRGVGKTVLLKQAHALSTDSVYISLDTLDRDTDLFQLIQNLNTQYKFTKFYLDEVHFIDSINADLKKIFDFLEVKIVFTSSVSLKLIESAYDLSRRIKITKLMPFSFREFLSFNSLPCPPKLTFQELIEGHYTSEHILALPYLERYLRGGNYPFSLEVSDVLGALNSNLEKIVRSDIPRIKKVTIDELDLIAKVFKFIARSSVSDINPNTVANNLKITRYKGVQYLNLLEDAFIIKQILPVGTNVLKEPKVLLSIPYRLLELNYESAIGGLREDFAVDCLINAGLQFNYIKSKTGEKTPDFLVQSKQGEVIIEIGGKAKNFRQFKGIDSKIKKIIFSHDNQIADCRLPLAFLGLLN